MDKELIKLTIAEAVALKLNATPEEIARLEGRIDPRNKYDCIYGKMTGKCNSKRAQELIRACCPRVYSTKGCDYLSEAMLNGPPEEEFIEDTWAKNRLDHYISPIEKFILLCGEDNIKVLVSFLKGKRKTLRFKF